MITKAIIDEIVSTHFVRVRIPLFDKTSSSNSATKNINLPRATICTLPNVYLNAQIGDIVYVAFEDNDNGRPVVIGYLSRDAEKYAKCDMTVDNLTVTQGITIGDITYENINSLKGFNDSIKYKFQEIEERLSALENTQGG